MIDSAISHIASELNRHLKSNFDLNEDVVVVSNIVGQDGSVAAHINNKIVVSLVNIEKDSVPFQQQNFTGAKRGIVTAPPLYFNLYLMFASYFSGNNYQKGLKLISSTIGYFHEQAVFDQKNSPGLDNKINKLILDVENLDMQNLSSLWGILSGKYLPSVLYRVRMVTYDSDAVKKQAPALRQPEPSLSH